MIKLTNIIVRRPVSAIAIIIAVIVFGILSATGMDQEQIPEMETPMMIVQTTYVGASPQDVEKLVSSKIEGAVGTLNGIKGVTSHSMENASMVLLDYEYGVNMDTAYIDLMERINRISGDLPSDANAPIIMEMGMNASNSMVLSVQSSTHRNLLNYVENEIKPEFEKLSSVAEVTVSGGQEEYIRIELKEEKLRQYGITMNTVISSVAAADLSMPNGSVTHGHQSVSVRSAVDYSTTEQLKTIPISVKGGGSIRLADVATITDAFRDAESIGRYNGEDTITVGIQKRQSANAANLSAQVNRVLEQLRETDGGININVVSDEKDTIQSSIISVLETLLLAVLISMVVLYLFLGDLRASLIVGSSIPISLLIALMLMSLSGYSLNMITLAAMVMGVGMMVDNSIVVLDSIFRADNQQKTPIEAAVEGTKFVVNSVIGSTVTTVVVFLPMGLLSGMAGQMLSPLGFTLVFSLVASLFSAITLVPLFFVRFKPRENRNAPAALLLKQVERGYAKLLKTILPKKKTVLALSLVFVVLSVFLATQLHVEMFTSNDEATVSIDVEMRPGLLLESQDEIMLQLEEMVAAHPDVDRYITTIDGGGSIMAYLKDKRKMETDEVVEQWRVESSDFRDCNISVTAYTMVSMLSSDDVSINLQGNDLETLRVFSRQVETVFRSHPDIISVQSALESGSPQAEIYVDPVKASSVGMSPSEVAASVSMALSGVEATTINRDGQDYAVRVEYPASRYEDMTGLRGMILVSASGTAVPLADIADIRMSSAPLTIVKEDNQYLVTVTGTPTAAAKYTAQGEITEQVRQLEWPDGVELTSSSMDDMMMEEITGLLMAIVIAILLVFLVMTIQFESFKHALMVMICIPFCMIGSFTFLFLARATLSIVSILGFLILVGTVVNSGILFVDTANEFRKSMDLQTALIHTARHRLRAIAMTTLTTILSMVPLAMAIGEGTEMMQGLGLVVIGGMAASTLLTLLFLPTFYLIIDGNPKKKEKKYWKKRRKMEEQKAITQ